MEKNGFSLAEVVRTSLRGALNNWQISFVFMLVSTSLSLPAFALSRLVRFLPDTWDFGFYALVTLLFLGFLGLFIGLIKNALIIYDEDIGSTFELFTSFQLLFKFLSASVLFYLPIVALLLMVRWIFFLAYGNWFIYIFGAFPVVFALIIILSILLRFRLYPYYIIDKHAGVFESLEKSFQATSGLGLKMVFVFIVSIIVSVIPFIGIMAGQLVWVSVYRRVTTEL